MGITYRLNCLSKTSKTSIGRSLHSLCELSRVCACRRALASPGGIDRKAYGYDQDATVEKILDVEGRTELLHARERKGEDEHRDQRANHVDTARADRSGAKQGRSKRGKQIFRPDARRSG